jgi:hypothetical protein
MLESRTFKRARSRALVATLLVGGVIWLHTATGAAAAPQVFAQAATATPLRLLTPTAISVTKTTSTSVTVTPAPRAGAFPLELAFPALAGGIAAISGGAYLVRRKLGS